MAKGVYRMADGQVRVEYGKRQTFISRAQYKANGYLPPYDKLLEGPPKSAKGYRQTPGNPGANGTSSP
jgi:hypothetical protein